MVASSRLASGAAVFFMLSGGIIAAFTPAYFATRDVRAWCDALPTGTSLNALESQAEARGYSVVHMAGNHVYVEHPRSLGRAYCDVGYDPDGRVTTKAAGN